MPWPIRSDEKTTIWGWFAAARCENSGTSTLFMIRLFKIRDAA
jgi:hypothetical protein